MTPFVSIVMPIRNEIGFIKNSINAVICQNFPKDKMEILIVDGESDDGTYEIIKVLEEKYNRIKLFNNPKKIVSSALNIGINRSKGNIIIRVDGHTTIDKNFINENIKLLNDHPEAWAVGGPIVHRGRNDFAKGVAITMSSWFGIGNANHRKENYKGYAEGAVFPAIRKSVFDKIGLFDERFVRNQDDEFNYRIIKSGGKIFISPTVLHNYYVRESPDKLWRQYLQYRYWKIAIMKKHKRPISLRHLVPLLFLLYITLMVTILVFKNKWEFVIALPLLIYISLLSLHIIKSLLKSFNIFIAIFSGISALIIHLSYGWGTLLGLFGNVLNKFNLEKKVTGLSR